jgi:GNAT superfamily N-acetyltransferase
MSNLELCRIDALDPEQVECFLREDSEDGSFRRLQTAAYYSWLSGPGPTGFRSASWAILDGDRLLGTLFAPLRDVWLDGELVLTAKLEEMRTHPDARGRGVMRLLFERVRDDAFDRGARILMAGPTSPFSYPIFRERFEFLEPFQIVSAVRPVRWQRTRGAISAPDSLPVGIDGMRQLEATAFDDPALGRFAETVTRLAKGAVWRDAGYLQWRYGVNPEQYQCWVQRRSGEIGGAVIVKRTRQRSMDVLNVVEVLAASRASRARVLGSLASEARRSDIGVVNCWVPQPSDLLKMVSRGYIPRPARTHFLLRTHPDLPEPQRAAAMDRRGWLLGMGDFFDI